MGKTKRKLSIEQIREIMEKPISREGIILNIPNKFKITRVRLMQEMEAQGD